MPASDSDRISASPLNMLNTGAPWKQSPESSHSERFESARICFASVEIRAMPPYGGLVNPYPRSNVLGTKLYGNSREWMSEVWMIVNRMSCPVRSGWSCFTVQPTAIAQPMTIRRFIEGVIPNTQAVQQAEPDLETARRDRDHGSSCGLRLCGRPIRWGPVREVCRCG